MTKFKIERQDDGSLITLKPAFEHEVIRWVLGEAGKIEVLYPEELRKKVANIGKKSGKETLKHKEKSNE